MKDEFSRNFWKGFKIGFFGYFAVVGVITIGQLQQNNKNLTAGLIQMINERDQLIKQLELLKGA